MKTLILALLILGTITITQAAFASCSGVQAWNGNCTTYKAGDQVTYNGRLYENCGCQGRPGGSNNCWFDKGECSGHDTCDTAPNWDETVTYAEFTRVRYAGRLFRSYCDGNKNKNPQYSTDAWESVASCNVCEQIYNVNHYYQGGWNSVSASTKKIYKASWWVGTNCAPGTNSVWVASGKCGCTVVNSFNYDSAATVNDGSCVPKIPGCTDKTAFNYNSSANVDDGSCVPVIVGCMTPGQFNYNPQANTPGTCIPVIVGCMTPGQFNYNPNANTAGTCIPVIVGCMTPGQFNYNPNANTAGTCIPVIVGCMTPGQFNYNPNANTAGTCIPVIVGCMTPGQFNYNPNANTAGTCIPVIVGCLTPGCFNYNPNANTAGTCIPVIVGCLDKTATNYDATANTAGTCTYGRTGCTDPKATNYDPLATIANNSCCIYPPPVVGCTDPKATNYNPLATVAQNDCCTYPAPIVGCTDPKASNYNPLATVAQNDCCTYTQVIYGCTDSSATNYDPTATVDNGCCEYKQDIWGCIDKEASNYDPAATQDADCCTYSPTRPNLGCNSPAWSATVVYTPYQVVTLNGRAWRLKDWGKNIGNKPGLDIWGAWELYQQCAPLENCCTSTAVYGGSKNYWVGDCVNRSWDNVNRKFRAQQNTKGTDPRNNCGPNTAWSTEIICP